MIQAGTGFRVGVLATAFFVLLAMVLALREGGRDVEQVETLLLTGFGPFGQVAENPSWEAARGLDGRRIGSTLVRTARLDVSYALAADQLRAAIDETRPDRVLCLGVAPGESIRLETLARNRDEAPVPDNDGVIQGGTPIRADGPALLPTGLPVKALLARLQRDGFEVVTSEDAGGYLCNHVFYVVRDTTEDRAVTGFVHVPPVSDKWPLERLEAAVRAMVETIDETP